MSLVQLHVIDHNSCMYAESAGRLQDSTFLILLPKASKSGDDKIQIDFASFQSRGDHLPSHSAGAYE